jgi:DNA-binding transcriptional regulator GbsR (MarR family)
LNKNDYKILLLLGQEQCFTEFKSFTLATLSEKTHYSIAKLRSSVKLLKALGYISEGAMYGQKKTYYITELGLLKIKENM